MLKIIETERLTLREINYNDSSDLAKVLSDPEVMKHSMKGVHSEEQLFEYINGNIDSYKKNGFGHWIIQHKLSGDFIGICGLNKHEIDNESMIHIVYRLAKNQQGNGYAAEAVKGVIHFSKKSLSLNSIYALIEPLNSNSLKIAQRTGFKFKKQSIFGGIKIDIFEVK